MDLSTYLTVYLNMQYSHFASYTNLGIHSNYIILASTNLEFQFQKSNAYLLKYIYLGQVYPKSEFRIGYYTSSSITEELCVNSFTMNHNLWDNLLKSSRSRRHARNFQRMCDKLLSNLSLYVCVIVQCNLKYLLFS